MKRATVLCAWGLAVGVGLFGCEHPVLIGRDCPRCEHAEMCHPQLLMCVACVHDVDCGHVEGRPWCDPVSFVCVQCVDAKQCSGATPLCVEGACRPCEVDPASCPAPPAMMDAAPPESPDAGMEQSPAPIQPSDGWRRGR